MAATTVDDLKRAAEDIRLLTQNLLAQGVGAEPLTRTIAALNDALSRRLLDLVEAGHDLAGIGPRARPKCLLLVDPFTFDADVLVRGLDRAYPRAPKFGGLASGGDSPGDHRLLLGTGIAEGIVAPQTASTATVAGHMVPLLTLGIPGSGATAVILGAFLLHGMQPGPQVFINNSGLVYAIFASLIVGVIGMCLMGYFAIKLLIKVLYLPEAATSAFVVLFCFIGAFSARNNVTDLWLIIGFGVLGYGFERLKFPVAPLVLGVILGPIAEDSVMNTMISFSNDWTVFFTRPISGTIVAFTIIVLLLPFVQRAYLKYAAARANRRQVTHA